MAEKATKIDIFSGFLGAGKTTLIKKNIHVDTDGLRYLYMLIGFC